MSEQIDEAGCERRIFKEKSCSSRVGFGDTNLLPGGDSWGGDFPVATGVVMVALSVGRARSPEKERGAHGAPCTDGGAATPIVRA